MPTLALPPHPVPWSHLQPGTKRRTSNFSPTGVCWCCGTWTGSVKLSFPSLSRRPAIAAGPLPVGPHQTWTWSMTSACRRCESCWRTSTTSHHASPRLSTLQVQRLEPGHGVWGGPCPATYTRPPIPAGVATDAKMGSELIQVLALDADIGNNSLVFYSILAIHYFRAFANDSEDVGQVFTMGRGPVTHGWPPRPVTAWTVVWSVWGVCVGTTGYGWPASQPRQSFR